MLVRWRSASDAHLDELLGSCASAALTYDPAGGSLGGPAPAGLKRRRWETALSSGSFDRAVHALKNWTVHRGAGLLVRADGGVAVGTNVAMSAPLGIAHLDLTCRIVAVIDEHDRFGFAYGTLPIHAERGEESFVVHREPARFCVEALSRPSHPLARLAPHIADRMQAAATRRYLRAMVDATKQ